jgi:hypothetical protein
MATVTPSPKLGKILVRVDRVYGRPAVYPVCEKAKCLAEIACTATLTAYTLKKAAELGFEVELAEGSANVLNEALNGMLKEIAR